MLDEGEDHPTGDAVVGPGDPGGELLFDEQLLHRPGGTSPRFGPMRHHVPGGDQLVELRLVLEAAIRCASARISARIASASGGRSRLFARLIPAAVRVKRSVDGPSPHQRLHGQSPAQMQVGVVLPGEPDAAVHLNVQLRVADAGGEGQRGGGRRDEPELLAALLRRAGGVPHTRHRGLRGHQHVGAVVLDGLEGRDGAAELLTHLGVIDGDLDAVRRTADGLGGEQGAGVGQRDVPRSGQHVGGRAGERYPAGAAGAVQVAGHLDAHATGVSLHHNDVVTGRQQQHIGQADAEHDSGVTGHRAIGERQAPPNPAAPVRVPSISPGRRRAFWSSDPTAARTADTTAVGTNGPGATALPSSSITTTSSGSPNPEPP